MPDFDLDPELPVSGHNHGDDDDESDDSKKKKKKELLRQARAALKKHADAYGPLRAESVTLFRRCMGPAHGGTWEELWPMIEAAQRLDFLRRDCTVLLGGWVPPSSSTAPPPPVPPDLHLALSLYAIGRTVAIALEACHRSQRADAESIVLTECLQDYNAHFGSARMADGCWDLAKVEEIIQTLSGAAALADIEWQLTFLKDDLYCFYPTATDPAAGWKDFFNFTLAYNYLPKKLRDDFGPYRLLILDP